jgi:hypothetical protein
MEFKEDSETSAMFNSRKKIREGLQRLVKEGVIVSQEIDMTSRIINNKIWYNVVYDTATEEYIAFILKQI